MKIHSKYLTNLDKLEKEAEALQVRPVPTWLGNFSFKIFGQAYGRNYGKITTPYLQKQIELLAALVPEQVFTTYFIQKYTVGSKVLSHRDPKNNIGMTVIGIFGTFTGAQSTCENKTYQLEPGDVAIQPCTIHGIQGPKHSVSPVTSGTRWALILNTIT